MRYGWVLVAGLSVTELVSWGVLVYGFAAFVVPMTAELGWPPAACNAAYAVGIGVSGLVAVPVGRWLQHRGARWLMTAGSVLTVLVLLAWSQVTTLAAFFAVFAVAGLAMAATLYEPAFALTTAWFGADRHRAVLVITVVAGLAGTVAVPTAGALSGTVGWRTALVWFAVAVAVLAVPIHALVIRDRPVRHPATPAPKLTRVPSLRWLAVCLCSATAAKTGLVVILVAYLVQRGYPLGQATLTTAAVGVAQVLGRLLATVVRAHRAHLALFAGQAVACGLLLDTGSGPVTVLAVVLFGLGFGLPELLRGTLVVEYCGAQHYPRINGVLSAWVVTARAIGPLLAGFAATLGYPVALGGAAVLCLLSVVSLAMAHRRHGAAAATPSASNPSMSASE